MQILDAKKIVLGIIQAYDSCNSLDISFEIHNMICFIESGIYGFPNDVRERVFDCIDVLHNLKSHADNGQIVRYEVEKAQFIGIAKYLAYQVLAPWLKEYHPEDLMFRSRLVSGDA